MKRTLLLATALLSFALPCYSDTNIQEDNQTQTAHVIKSEDMQKKFIDIATKYRNEMLSSKPKNDIQIRLLLKKRAKEFNELNFDGTVKNWKGSVAYASATGNRIFFDIEIAPEIELSVKMDIDNPLVETLAVLEKNQKVIFSGNLVPDIGGKGFDETSFTTKGSLKEPEFSFNLTEIELVR